MADSSHNRCKLAMFLLYHRTSYHLACLDCKPKKGKTLQVLELVSKRRHLWFHNPKTTRINLMRKLQDNIFGTKETLLLRINVFRTTEFIKQADQLHPTRMACQSYRRQVALVPCEDVEEDKQDLGSYRHQECQDCKTNKDKI